MLSFVLSKPLFFKKNFNKQKKTLRFKMTTDLEKFASYISGEWGNQKQASEFPALWSHIRTCYRPLDNKLFGEHSFYFESAYDYSIDLPYKTSVLVLLQKGDLIEANTFFISKPEQFWYGSYEPSLLRDLTPERLTKAPDGCNIEFKYDSQKDLFLGKTKPGKGCIIMKKEKKTFLDSQFNLGKKIYSSWDVGRDSETDELIWGSKNGPFKFEKLKDFF